ncbi:MAG: DUF5658 family protein [Acidimicrobiales bacterium]
MVPDRGELRDDEPVSRPTERRRGASALPPLHRGGGGAHRAQAIDLVLTLMGRARGVGESNPFSAYLFEHAGVVLAVKFLIPLALLALALTESGRRRIDELHLAAIWVVTGIYLMTVVVNAMAVFLTSSG